MRYIVPPTNCPDCNSVLQVVNQLLYCKNPDCGAQAQKRVEHFAKTMKIKGLGPSAISKLNLTNIANIYTLTVDEIAEGLSSEALAVKLFAEIEKSKKAPANMLLPALSIPLIGKSATAKLSSVVEHIFDIDKDSCVQAGLGPKAAENLLTWLDSATERGFWDYLPFSLEFKKPSTRTASKGTVCISGRLSSFKTKAEATKVLLDAGYEVSSSLTKAVTILVNESGVESAKTQKARESGIKIVTNLSTFLGDN